MKTIHIISVFLLVLLSVSCKDQEILRNEESGLVGKWKLVEYLADPGDGSGTWQPVSEELSHTIEFHADGRFTEVKGKALSSVPLFKAYKLKDGNLIEMLPIDESTDSHIWTYTDLSATKLTLSYGCIEACGGKYVSIK